MNLKKNSKKIINKNHWELTYKLVDFININLFMKTTLHWFSVDENMKEKPTNNNNQNRESPKKLL